VLYENVSWAPALAVLADDDETAVPIGDIDPLESTVMSDIALSKPLGSAAVGPGTLLLAEAYDDGWTATANGKELPHGRAFGFTNSFTQGTRAEASIEHTGDSRRTGVLLLQLALWVVAVTWWLWGRSKEPRLQQLGVRVRTDREERRERRRPFEEIDLGEEFWEST
jgi:hypothetical protein